MNLPLQTPKDGYHLIVHGLILQLFALIYNCVLNVEQRTKFDIKLATFPYPASMARITFNLGKKLGRRWGFAVYRTLMIISPFLLRYLVDDDVMELVNLVRAFYFIAFARTLSLEAATRALPLARKIVNTISDKWPHNTERGYNVNLPTLHSLLELGREIPVFGNCHITGTEREEARHADPKGDLPRTNRRDIAVRLATLDADRTGKISVAHGTRWRNDDGRIEFDPVGPLRCGQGVLHWCDPTDPSRPHPLLLKLTGYSALPGSDTVQTRAQHFVRELPGESKEYRKGSDGIVRKVLSEERTIFLRQVCQEQKRPTAAAGALDVKMATEVVVRDGLYRLGEDIRVQSGSPQPWVARIVEIGSLALNGGGEVPIIFVHWLRPTGRKELNLQVLLADPNPEPKTVVFPESVIGRTSAFHNCTESGPAAKQCKFADVRLCKPHNQIDCGACPENSGTLTRRYVCSASNPEWLYDEHFGNSSE